MHLGQITKLIFAMDSISLPRVVIPLFSSKSCSKGTTCLEMHKTATHTSVSAAISLEIFSTGENISRHSMSLKLNQVTWTDWRKHCSKVYIDIALLLPLNETQYTWTGKHNICRVYCRCLIFYTNQSCSYFIVSSMKWNLQQFIVLWSVQEYCSFTMYNPSVCSNSSPLC